MKPTLAQVKSMLNKAKQEAISSLENSKFLAEQTLELTEDWHPLKTTKPTDVVKVKTKKSGLNYFYVVDTDVKAKEFYVVTPKQFNNDQIEKTMTVSFDDVVMVSTDDLPETPEKGGKKDSGVTKHTAKFDTDKDDE